MIAKIYIGSFRIREGKTPDPEAARVRSFVEQRPEFRETFPDAEVVKGNFDKIEFISAIAVFNDFVSRTS